MRFAFQKLQFEDQILTFDPAVLVEARHDCERPNFKIEFDFGLKLDYDSEEEIFGDIHALNDCARRFLEYHLIHAFFNCKRDPNYTVLHWALWGNLKDRIKVLNLEVAEVPDFAKQVIEDNFENLLL